MSDESFWKGIGLFFDLWLLLCQFLYPKAILSGFSEKAASPEAQERRSRPSPYQTTWPSTPTSWPPESRSTICAASDSPGIRAVATRCKTGNMKLNEPTFTPCPVFAERLTIHNGRWFPVYQSMSFTSIDDNG